MPGHRMGEDAVIRFGRGIATRVAVAAMSLVVLSLAAAAEERPPLFERLEAKLQRPLSAQEGQRVRELSAGAAAELEPVHARYIRDVAALAEQPEDVVAALVPELAEPPTVPTIVPQLERRMNRPLSLVEHRRLIEADQAYRRTRIMVRDSLARRLSELLALDYSQLRVILRESRLAG